jgi:hypothetical protein
MTPPDIPEVVLPVEILCQVNEYLRLALIRLRPDQKQTSTITPLDFSDLLSQLLRAGQCLRSQPPHSKAASGAESAAIEKEALEYRTHLGELFHFLPDLQARLLAERSRLELAQAHLAATAAWARANKKTI